MATTFEVVSRDDGSALHLRTHDSNYVVAALRGLNLTAQARVGTYMSAGLAEMFAGMAANWRGWTGAKTWSSLEGELHLSAEADRTGHVTLTIELREGAPAVWSVTLQLVIEAGRLDDLARAARAFEDSSLSAD
jgi:hypothetical protein